MTLQSAVIPGFNNGISQQAATNRRPNQGELQVNGLGTLVDGLMQRPGTNHLAVLTSNAANGVFAHGINRDVDEQFIVMLTGDASEPIEVFDLAGVKQTVQYGTLDAAGENFSLDNQQKAYALPWSVTDLVTNGTFDTDTDWDKGDGWSISAGRARCNGTQVAATDLDQDTILTDTKYYKISFEVSVYSAGNVTPYAGSGAAGTARSAEGVYEEIIQCSGSTDLIFKGDVDFDARIDNVTCVQLDDTVDPSEVFKAVTVADNTFIVNRRVTAEITGDVDAEVLDDTVQTFADLPGTPADEDVVCITGDDVTGFDDWYVQYTLATDVWAECRLPGVSTGHFKDFSMPYRLVHTGTTTFTFAPCIWQDREVGDTNSTPTPSFVNNVIQNVFFFKNRLAFLSEDNVIMSRTGEYFNFYTETALDVIDSDPIDVSATSKQVENLRSVAVFDKSLILLADQQQFDFGSGESNLTPTTVSITPTTRFNICQLCEPVTAGPNVYFVCPKTDFATIREYYIQPDSLLNDAADVTAHVPQYVPMGHIQMAACNSLDMLLVHSDADPDTIYLYKYFWAGEEKAQASWSKWTFDGDIYGMVVIGTVAYFIIKNPDTSEICMESMELETTTTGALGFRVHADRLTTVTGVYVAGTDTTTWTTEYDMDTDNDTFVVIHPTTGRPVVEAVIATANTITVTGDYSDVAYHIAFQFEMRYRLTTWYLKNQQGAPLLQGRLQVRTLVLNFKDTGYYKVEVTPTGRDKTTDVFSGAIIGVSVIGAVSLHTGEQRHTIKARNTKVQVDIVTDSYIPAAFQAGSWEGIYYPRGKER